MTPKPSKRGNCHSSPATDPAAVAAAVAEWNELRSRINRFNSLPMEVLRSVAAGRIAWPVMAGRGQVQIRDQAELLEAIDLGLGVPIRDNKRGERKIPNLSDPTDPNNININDLARCYLMMAVDNRARHMTGTEDLPELSQESSREWAAHCWDLFLTVVPRPELDPTWEKFGRHRQFDSAGRKTTIGKKTRELSIRAGIREAFCLAISRLIRS